MINLKYSFPTKTPFKSKITCKGLIFTSFMFTSGGNLKPSRKNLNPLSSSTISWTIGGSFSSLTPSNPARGDCDHDGIDGPKDGRDTNAHGGRDTELRHNEGWIGDDIGFF